MTALEQARSLFEAGQFANARAAAAEGLSAAPEDVELLRLAGRAGVEIGAEDAPEQLRKVADLEPGSAEAWRDLGDALAAEGRTDEANEAFRRVLEIEPDDEVALTALGHTSFQAGESDAGVSLLERAVARGTGGSTTAAISLVEMYRSLGQLGEALAAARRVAQASPEEPLYALDVAELALESGELDEAADAFARVRALVDLSEDEVGALHGLIKVELARGRSDGALEFARQAGAIDTVGRTPGLLAHLEAEAGAESSPEEVIARGQTIAFMEAQQAPPSREEAEQLIDATLRDLRQSLSGEGRG
jgi:tetratricopeptide (TPR) repeat protein